MTGEDSVKNKATPKSRKLTQPRKANVLRQNSSSSALDSSASNLMPSDLMSTTLADNSSASGIISAARELSRQVEQLEFSAPVAFWYNPLEYAWAAHQLYLQRFAQGRKRIIWLGMNPGPWGMAQTGVPFGEINMVKNWLGIEAEVNRPHEEDPRRPISGFKARRSEVSGRRVWGLFANRYASAADFAKDNYVLNWCPLIFFSDAAVNITPDKIAPKDRAHLYEVCDRHLKTIVAETGAEIVIGIGKFAYERARDVLTESSVGGKPVKIGQILHPSPASPRANRGWAREAMIDLAEMGISI
jgi:single-strand selective monofunctional uracil DNA glycosylase